MTIHLPKDVARSIQDAVDRGHFASAEDALAAAWRSFNRREAQPEPRAANALTPEDLNRQLLADGLISRLPDPAEDVDDDDVPVAIKGELISETIIRERR